MTGFGEGSAQSDHLTVTVEVRALNHRHLKINIKGLDVYSALEPRIEPLLRDGVRRGSIQLLFRIARKPRLEDYILNTTALVSFWRQLQEVKRQVGDATPLSLGELLSIRGVMQESETGPADREAVYHLIEKAMKAACDKLSVMRRDEGRCMAEELSAHGAAIRNHLETISARAPQVVQDYRNRLCDRVNVLLASRDLNIDQEVLIKELSIFAERSDISEEVVRLLSHLEQFQATLDEPASEGRRLEFLSQEMVREANTIGSKANDVQIAKHVVEIKAAIERIRELTQNVE